MRSTRELGDSTIDLTLHWVNTHYPVEQEIHSRLDQVPFPFDRFFEFGSVGARTMLEALLLPSGSNEPVLKVDFGRLGRGHYRELYRTILELFCFKLIFSLPRLRNVFPGYLATVVGTPGETTLIRRELHEQVESERAVPGSVMMRNWKRLCEIIGSTEHTNAAKYLDYATMATVYFTNAVQATLDELENRASIANCAPSVH